MKLHNYTKARKAVEINRPMGTVLPQYIYDIPWNAYDSYSDKFLAFVRFVHFDLMRAVPFFWVKNFGHNDPYWTEFKQYTCYYTPKTFKPNEIPDRDFSVAYSRKLHRKHARLYHVNVLKLLCPVRGEFPFRQKRFINFVFFENVISLVGFFG